MKKSVVFLLIVFSFISCSKENEITIAEQYGLAYAPLQIMREKAFLEELESGLNVKWIKLGNTAAIREAVLAGEVDVGFMGIPPFLIGVDNGMEWQLISGLSVCPLGLVADSTVISSFGELSPNHRIALPQPGSIQHILLSMAAEKHNGDSSFFDSGLVTMKHPDGMSALLSGAVDAHFTSPPYVFMETGASERFRIILSGEEAFGGEFSFIAAMATDDFIRNSPEHLASFLEALSMSISFINENPEQSAQLLSDIYDLSSDEIFGYITRPGMKYTSEIYGLEQFISFMTAEGYLKGIIR